MPTIFTIGETILDIIFENNQPVAAKAGGSMLNSAVSLGRCGLQVEMLTELGDDTIGEMVKGFLNDNGVGTLFLKPAEGFKTPVSIAFLDEKGNAQYSFYKQYPSIRALLPLAVGRWPLAVEGDVVLFGSFYSLDAAIREEIVSFVKEAKRNGAIIIYDPNIRKNHLEEVEKLMSFVQENIALADIIRGSDEDFDNLFGLDDVKAVHARVKSLGCGHLIRTCGRRGAELFAGDTRLHLPAPKINVVSTIGAGDSFNAGIIYGLVKNGVTPEGLEKLDLNDWCGIMEYGIRFAAEVCCSYDNYIDPDSEFRIPN
ncbi:MAG: carbohydrate kinase [Bacteroidales bacterium]|nr:carbohydrate kinase [Bacteroidales bacterium]